MSKLILIADDDKGIVEVTKIVLEEAGFATIVAHDASSVLETIKTSRPSLLLLDIWLAGENGAALAKKLKKDKNTKQLPIIMISANNNVEQMAKDSGADDFIAKPFDIEYLVQTVTKHIHED
jgi:DNA-binding response OmpR family regulator